MTFVISPDENAWETNFGKCFVVAWWPSKSSNSEIQKHGESIYIFSSRTVLHFFELLKSLNVSPTTEISYVLWIPIQRHLWARAGKFLTCGKLLNETSDCLGWSTVGIFYFSLRESFGSFNPELWSKGDFNLSRICDLVSWCFIPCEAKGTSTHPPQQKNCRFHKSSIRPAISWEGGIWGGVGPLDHIQVLPQKGVEKANLWAGQHWYIYIALKGREIRVVKVLASLAQPTNCLPGIAGYVQMSFGKISGPRWTYKYGTCKDQTCKELLYKMSVG